MSWVARCLMPLTNAMRAKGPLALLHRVRLILQRYGLTPRKMVRALDTLVQTLMPFGCKATLPTTAIAIRRHPHILAPYRRMGIEFIVHGYRHVDYAVLAPDVQRVHLTRAREIFQAMGSQPKGFRSPYLRRQSVLYAALCDAGFTYVSNQPVLWNVIDLAALPSASRARYERAVSYYMPWDADKRISTPRLLDGLVEIPVSLPDDEILVDRLGSTPDGLILEAWTAMLDTSYRRGELLTLQFHPERSALCAPALIETLRRALALTPSVWIARLDEIAAWWRARALSNLNIVAEGQGVFHVVVNGPPELGVLVRNLTTDAPVTPWADDYQHTMAHRLTVYAPRRPCIGVSATTDPTMIAFLREQGYPVELTDDAEQCALYLNRPVFAPEQELSLLQEIDTQRIPMIRLGLWPLGRRSALVVTGDIDVFTLWDYVLRLIGR